MENIGKIIRKCLLLVGGILPLANTAFAQAQMPSWEVGGGLGAMVYKGDLAPGIAPRNLRPAANLLVRYNVSQPFTVRANFGLGRIAADDASTNDPFQQARNLSFKTNISEANLLFEYNFLDFANRRRVLNWTPYVMGGLGVFSMKPNPNSGGYKTKMLMNFPLGIGIKYEFKRPWIIGLEMGTRFTRSDYLDNFGPNTFGGTDKLRNGNPNSKDSYTYVGLLLSYRFYKIDCPQ
ncbi:type IX secretion system protein PorG [Tellurirhabdus bombi]|uniref:type IX secretion system protein PorG n=1 Tax=Tellurirhabdus bombi TaxID=2907205 RepID=UPI00286E4BE2|nr:DUF6089 family protein [Tellurirhabdus bombi]